MEIEKIYNTYKKTLNNKKIFTYSSTPNPFPIGTQRA